MRVFLYEHLTALGLGREPGDPLHSMYREGLAMRDALAADLAAIPGCLVSLDPDATSEASLLIAPETDGVLLELATRHAATHLGCSPDSISLTSDKLELAKHWRANGVRTPATSDREPTPCEAFPVVWKPRDGCGSSDTFLLNDVFDLARAKSLAASTGPMIVQEFVPGRAASVAFLCGPGRIVPLLPALQLLSDDGRFSYLGGELPLPPGLAQRAVALAGRAVACVPGLKGYVGVDLVLGNAEDGSADYAIEINPRLTTSYVGLRALVGFNVAEAMLAIALGEAMPRMEWKPGRVRFAADGSVSPADPA